MKFKRIEQEAMLKKIETVIRRNMRDCSNFCFYHCDMDQEKITCCDDSKCKLHPDYIGKKILKKMGN